MHSLRYYNHVARILAILLCFPCRYQGLQVEMCSSPSIETIRLDHLTTLCPRTTQKPNDVVESTSQRCTGRRTGSRIDLQVDLE